MGPEGDLQQHSLIAQDPPPQENRAWRKEKVDRIRLGNGRRLGRGTLYLHTSRKSRGPRTPTTRRVSDSKENIPVWNLLLVVLVLGRGS